MYSVTVCISVCNSTLGVCVYRCLEIGASTTSLNMTSEGSMAVTVNVKSTCYIIATIAMYWFII